jgi:hypothetical protein
MQVELVLFENLNKSNNGTNCMQVDVFIRYFVKKCLLASFKWEIRFDHGQLEMEKVFQKETSIKTMPIEKTLDNWCS